MGQALALARPTILVVDDDAIIRLELVDMLEEQGFIVLDAADADEAIELMEAHADIEAVLTDVEMPGTMDGIKLVHCIRDRWPPAVLIVISARALAADRPLPAHTAFYGKPLDGGRLVRDLRATLAS